MRRRLDWHANQCGCHPVIAGENGAVPSDPANGNTSRCAGGHAQQLQKLLSDLSRSARRLGDDLSRSGEILPDDAREHALVCGRGDRLHLPGFDVQHS